MKREIKILIETDSALVEEGCVRVAVTELDDTYRLHSLSAVYDQLHSELAVGGLQSIVGQQVASFLSAEPMEDL